MRVFSIKQLLSNVFFLTTLIFFLQLGIWTFLSLRPYSIAPPGYVYTQIGKNYFYPNLIAQSKDGAWGLIDSDTTRPVAKVYIHGFFITLGKIARLTNISSVMMYQLAQLLGGLVLFYVTAWIISVAITKPYQPLAILFALTLESGPLLSHLMKNPFSPVTSFIPGFETQLTFERHFGLPHHVWGEAFGLASLALLLLCIVKPSRIKYTALVIVTLCATITLPPFITTILLTVIPTSLLVMIRTKKIRTMFIPLMLFSLVSVLVGLFIKIQLTNAVPWDVLTATEKTWWADGFIIERYISSFLLFYPGMLLLILCLPLRFRQWSAWMKFIMSISIAWLIGPLLYIPVTHFSWFPVANGRLTDGYGYVPAAILASIGIVECMKLIHSVNMRRLITTCMIGILLACSIGLTTRYIGWTMENQNYPWNNQYVTTDTMDAIRFFETIPPFRGIMATQYTGEVIHAFADVRIFVGGPHGFIDWGERQWLVGYFYRGDLSDAQALQFLKNNDISYVFFGPAEQTLNTTGTLYPNILDSPIYTNKTVNIYKVTK